jgi:hypothetical protein
MTWNEPSPVSETVEHLSEELCHLLDEQVASAREGNLSRVEQLSVQAEGIVAKMTREGADEPSLSDERREHLKRLYAELVLTLRAEQAGTQARLRQLRQVKRAVGAYAGRIRP